MMVTLYITVANIAKTPDTFSGIRSFIFTAIAESCLITQLQVLLLPEPRLLEPQLPSSSYDV